VPLILVVVAMCAIGPLLAPRDAMSGVVLVALFLILAGLAIVLGRYLLRRRRMEHVGRLVQGRVLECRGGYDSDRDFWVRIHHEFVSPSSGVPLQGKKKQVRSDLRPSGGGPFFDAPVPDDLLPKRGTPVLVMYVDDSFFEIL
jgi:hypothetical protein